MSPEAKVDIVFGVIEVFIGLATIAVGFASWLQARENRVHAPPAVAGPVVYRVGDVPAQKDDQPVDHKGIKTPSLDIDNPQPPRK